VITYCTNIHPGEAWADVRLNLESHVLAVKEAFSPGRPFPIGLRVSHQASQEIDGREAARFRDWCRAHGCFVLTVNGFPHGRFSGAGVKEKVYEPDWRSAERAAYTKRLADLLAGWLPAGVPGSISSVPVAFRRGFDAADWPAVRANLIEVLVHLERIRERGGPQVVLALEPEPGCVLETTADVLAFFERMAFPAPLADLAGICFDCCHQAVEFEAPADALRRLEGAGIPIGKFQISSSLRAVGQEIAALAAFDEPVYLHQVVARTGDGSLQRWDDLPQFLAEAPRGVEECRVHFHVPIFAPHLGACGTTQFFLEEILPLVDPAIPLEVETYSWNVLPPALRTGSVAESIVRELEWVRKRR
jgi:sugar phosphate isomerase/epimerase